MTVNTPDTMLIQLGIKLQENLGGKMVITSDGATAYAISQSGFIVLPIGTLKNQPMGMPDSTVALLASDQCGVTAALNSATIPVRDIGGGRITVTAQALASVTTTPTVRATSKTYGGDVTAQFSAVAARTLGTAASDQLLIQANEAVNIIPTVRVFQNTRNAEARGTILPIDWGASSAGLADMLGDTARQRIYIANPGLNRLEVFDMKKQVFLTPIPVSQLPRSMAFGSDGNTLYVASGGGEQISIVDLTQGQVTGRVLFPPLPFNATFGLITPALLASSQRGPQVIMSDGTLWKIVGNQVTLRPLNTNVFGTARSIPAPQTMVSTPEGSYVLILGGNGTAFLYSSDVDDFVSARSVVPTPISGYYGPVAAGPNGQYFLVNDQVLNVALTPNPLSGTGATGGGALPAPGGPSSTGRPVAAVAAVGGSSYARFSIPVTAANATPSDTGLVEVVDVNTLRTTATAGALEMPSAVVRAGARVNVIGRSMVLDSAGATAFVLTASGLSVIPLATSSTPNVPQVPASGVVNTADFLSGVAPGGLVSIFGTNLGIGCHVGQFTPANPAWRRLRYAQQLAPLPAGQFSHADQRPTASHPRRGTVSAGGPVHHRADRIVFHHRDHIEVRSGSLHGRAGRRALPRQWNPGQQRPPRHPRRRAHSLRHRPRRHYWWKSHGRYSVAGQSARGHRARFALFWKSVNQRGGDYRRLERTPSRLHRRLPDQLPHSRSPYQRRRAAHHLENRWSQQPHHRKQRAPGLGPVSIRPGSPRTPQTGDSLENASRPGDRRDWHGFRRLCGTRCQPRLSPGSPEIAVCFSPVCPRAHTPHSQT